MGQALCLNNTSYAVTDWAEHSALPEANRAVHRGKCLI